jgi:UDP-N-acetylglucosamine 2-epimerase (non-hydrolysing)
MNPQSVGTEATRVLVVIGTRPEAIKLAPVVRALRADRAFEVHVCATSQHDHLLRQMLGFFQLACDFDLSCMRPGQTLVELTQRLLSGMGDLLARERYDQVVVQGDTTTAFVAGLAAFYARIPVVHVEAGLRSGDLQRPFPEEANRRLLDVVSSLLLAPTTQAGARLLAEGYPAERIFITGNTGIDALLLAVDIVRREGRTLPIALTPGERLALVTAHRRESFGPGLEQICRALATLVERHPNLHVLYPVHPNPNVVAVTDRLLRGLDRVHLVAPLDYPEFVCALMRADLILTDSGGIQEEAPALGKYTLVLRDTTERPEGVAAGSAELVGTDAERIVARAEAALARTGTTVAVSPYGDGAAAARVVEILKTGKLSHPFGADSSVRSVRSARVGA